MQEELLKNDLEENESATEDLEEEEEPKQARNRPSDFDARISERNPRIQAPRKKKTLNENQRKAVALNLAKGRENLKKKQ